MIEVVVLVAADLMAVLNPCVIYGMPIRFVRPRSLDLPANGEVISSEVSRSED